MQSIPYTALANTDQTNDVERGDCAERYQDQWFEM